MIRIREAIVVEGKYDKIRLSSLVDALIVETNGFGIFRDREQRAMLRLLARERGLILLTDSDSAGMVIRNHLLSFIPPEQVKHAYIPEMAGKERRKSAPSREGLLGVEGMDSETLMTVLRRAGATVLDEKDGMDDRRETLTKQDLYAWGLTGGADSAEKRRQLLLRLGLPRTLSANRLLEVLNAAFSRETVEEWLHSQPGQPSLEKAEEGEKKP